MEYGKYMQYLKKMVICTQLILISISKIKVNVGGKGMVIQLVFIPPNMNGQGTLKMGTVHSKS